MYGSYSLIPKIKAKRLTDLVVASPDKGGVGRATAYAKRLGADGIAIVFKERDVSLKNQSKTLDMIGDVKGKNVVIVDDIIDTAGSITNAAELFMTRGAKKVYAVATHGLFSGPALERIIASPLEEIFVTNTIPMRKEVLKNTKIKVVSVAPLLAEAIKRTHLGKSFNKVLVN